VTLDLQAGAKMPAVQVANQSRLPRRQTILFLIAIFVPCAILIVLGLRIMDQDRQLEDKRNVEERKQRVAQIRQDLLASLEKIKLQQVARAVSSVPKKWAPPIALIATLDAGGLHLPWDDNPNARKFSELLDEPEFARLLRQAENEELVTRQYALAADHYKQAIQPTRHPTQQTYARLLYARTLEKAGRHPESVLEYSRVFDQPRSMVDEHGVPFALYAAPRLLDAQIRGQEILDWIRLALNEERSFPPAALYLMRDLTGRLQASDLQAQLSTVISETEQSEILDRDSSRLSLIADSSEPTWISYDDWLVSLGPLDHSSRRLIIAVHSPITPASVSDESAEQIGPNFPGLRIALPELKTEPSNGRRTMLATALALSLGVTILAGYILWRDTKRELRLAEMRSQFVSSVSHELRTPLTAIRMYTETMRLDEEMDRDTRCEYLDTILHESERLTRLVDNVLDFGKIERGKKIYHFKPVRLDEVVDEAARALQYPLEQSGFELNVNVDRSLPDVHADSDALQQAVLNLLSNAMKYSGGSRQIELRLNRNGGRALIAVVDHGIGIAAEEQPRLVEQFYRAPIVENQRIPGTGLGLTLVDYIAKAHGGVLAIQSIPGSGSTFTISLPLGNGGNA
jgi:signal transduction histidine kinase